MASFIPRPPRMDKMKLYLTLAVPYDADVSVIRSAYKKLAMQYHPDRCSRSSSEEKALAASRFQEISNAFETLSDPAKRAAYDKGCLPKYGSSAGGEGEGSDDGRSSPSQPVTTSSEIAQPAAVSSDKASNSGEPETVGLCAQCSERFLPGGTFLQTGEDQVHESCMDAYIRAKAPDCGHCGRKVMKGGPAGVKGEMTSSGRYYMAAGDDKTVKIHTECWGLYVANQCVECGQGVTGSHYTTPDGKVHAEGFGCYAAYKQRIAPACAMCGAKVTCGTDGTAFSGRAIKTKEGDSIHEECHDAYRLSKAPKCLNCREAISSVGGRFSGKFYEMKQHSGVVHEECLEQFKTSEAPISE